jgi:hypothetical protein
MDVPFKYLVSSVLTNIFYFTSNAAMRAEASRYYQGTPAAVTGFFCKSMLAARFASIASLSTPLAQHQLSTSASVTLS